STFSTFLSSSFFLHPPIIINDIIIISIKIVLKFFIFFTSYRFSWIQVTSATLFEKEGLTANKFTLLLIVSTQNKRGDRNGLSAVNP
ncbi:MAG TPA: hypothetical protein PLZ29_02955, partial [Spirochaetota bacterium]|nr:hypothetical protein [Spirochaetota bacterium]